MLKKEREAKILELISKSEYLTIAEIAKELKVSEMTIRRDITDLSNANRVTRLYGGIKKKDEASNRVFTTEEKIPTNIEEKKYIGKVMNSMIQDNSTIFLAAGTTIFYALPEITAKNLFIVTNSLIAFNYIKDYTNHRVLLAGGEFNKVTDEFYGTSTIRTFDNLNIDIAFAATNGIIGPNVTSSSVELGYVEIAAFEKARIKAVVADSSKFGKSDVYTFITLDKVDFVVTDNKISNSDKQLYEQYTRILSEEISK